MPRWEDFENRVADAFRHWGYKYLQGHCFCFLCGHHFYNPNHLQHRPAHQCAYCGVEYSEKGQCALPDGIIDNGGNIAVIFVNGSIHGKNHIERKDRQQFEEYGRLAIKVIVMNADEIGSMTETSLRHICRSYWTSITSESVFNKAREGEKEYPMLRANRPGRL